MNDSIRGRLIDSSIGRNGKERVTIELDTRLGEQYDELSKADISVTLRKYRRHRSLDANAYAWVLIDRLAEVLGLTREEVYREQIRAIGGVSETVCIKREAVDKLIEGWTHNGLGWQTETMPSRIDGCVNVVLYYGSSTYDTKQMSALIDALAQECRNNGIETLPPEQLALLSEEWGGNKE